MGSNVLRNTMSPFASLSSRNIFVREKQTAESHEGDKGHRNSGLRAIGRPNSLTFVYPAICKCGNYVH